MVARFGGLQSHPGCGSKIPGTKKKKKRFGKRKNVLQNLWFYLRGGIC